jgi:hypothetical protein
MSGGGYPYAKVEAALGAALGTDDTAQRGALRGRIKHLQRVGLVAEKPGKGQRLAYDPARIDDWLIALELGKRGLDPTVVVRALKAQPDYLAETTRLARSRGGILLLLRTNLEPWANQEPLSFLRFDASDPEDMERLVTELQGGAGGVIFDLSSLLRRLDVALVGTMNVVEEGDTASFAGKVE